ncbi:hypothetical protein FRX31_008468 [Thalictrum thalictroides]|uniref:B3 domain-containing protein n=1 Tax=Thalictrum thalictroides TaxID=46969 RepID=A0A7J6WZE2_THATH|nr:hypothetical protein FRX31_008468 [Thalictrum thalictroides]
MTIRQKKRLLEDSNEIQEIDKKKKKKISDEDHNNIDIDEKVDAEPKHDTKDVEVGKIVNYCTMKPNFVTRRPTSVKKLQILNDMVQNIPQRSAALCSDKKKGKKVKKGNMMKDKFEKEIAVEEPPMPSHIKEVIVYKFKGYNITWVNKKTITESDVSATQSRLYLPNQLPKVLTEAENNHLLIKPQNTLDVLVVDHTGLDWIIELKYWPGVYRYVFGKMWLELAGLYNIRPVVNEFEIWSFRRLLDEKHGSVEQLCFALNFPKLKNSQGASTSGGANALGNGLDGGMDVSGTNTNSIGDRDSGTDHMNGDSNVDGIGTNDVTMA